MRLLVAAGASGGGVYPALAVLQELFGEKTSGDEDLELLWVGGEGGMEEDLVSRAGYQLRTLPAAGLHGVGLLQLPRNFIQLARGYLAARRLLGEFKPEVLFFTGGFVAAPVAIAGFRVPTLAFVPDIQPGFTLRLIARFADFIAVVAEETRQFFTKSERVRVTGYPLRSEFTRWKRADAIKHFDLENGLPTLLVFGGSKGARSINKALIGGLRTLLQEMQIIHVTGLGNWEAVEVAMKSLPADLAGRYHAFSYLHGDMGAAFAAADLAVCRAGASTLGELPQFSLPAILVPIPFREHLQHVNAAYLKDRGAAEVLPDGEMQGSLVDAILELVHDRQRLRRMSTAMSALAKPNAATHIAELLRNLGTPSGRKVGRA
ncbi:MAG TPA: UDP-N-acetylglucosamine--N-acetylmuramyl-(pentapeptide) pyrophosphoryl-undecaprenol N-acetylglucosamine transferase [Anaerolineales bacterium]|nr:UDP-N-acetylglucosamine--N-acetylmuramyl-(pentapeptide) pyrophosphoryl-undecaprenol N-acetylglucosamine transferase [Anaerolineales bacterium]